MRFKCLLVIIVNLIVVGCQPILNPINRTDHFIERRKTLLPFSPFPLDDLLHINVLLETTEIEMNPGETIYPVTNPTWSHDGQWVAFSDNDEQGGSGIWIVEPNSWDSPQKICAGSPVHNLIWSPNNTKLLFSEDIPCSESERCWTKRVTKQCDIVTGQVTLFPSFENQISTILDWYRDYLLFDNKGTLVLYDFASQKQRTLDLPEIGGNHDLITSVDLMDNLEVMYMTRNQLPAIQIVNIQTGEVRQLISPAIVENTSPTEWNVSSSPNGRWIIWLSRIKLPDLSIYDFQESLKLYDLQTNQVFTLLDEQRVNGTLGRIVPWTMPSWSPESNQLVFMVDHKIKFLTFTIDER